jgi:hypothetical protein
MILNKFVVHAYRYGRIDAHNYLVGVTEFECDVKDIARRISLNQAKKYGIMITESDIHNDIIKSIYYPSQFNEEYLYYEGCKIESLSKFISILSMHVQFVGISL